MLDLLLAFTAACTPASGNAAAVVQRAARVTGLDALGSSLLHIEGNDVTAQDYQSDRWYPPFLSNVGALHDWYAPATGIERLTAGTSMASYSGPGPTIVSTEHASYIARDTGLVASEEANGASYTWRPLNAWAVIHDWIAD